MYTTYILWSDRIQKYYVGSTADMIKRLERHNSSREKYTSIGVPWKIVYTEEFQTRGEAIKKGKPNQKKRSKKIYRKHGLEHGAYSARVIGSSALGATGNPKSSTKASAYAGALLFNKMNHDVYNIYTLE